MIFKSDVLPKGLEEAIMQMSAGDEKEISLSPEKAFGEPKKFLVKVLSTNYFQSQNVKPEPGLTVYLDTDKGRKYGVIRSVNSGRVVIDLNHPLAGKNVRYKLKLVDVITPNEDKIKALLSRYGMQGNVILKDGNLTIELSKKAEIVAAYERSKVPLAMSIKKIFRDIKNIDVKEVD